MAAVERTLDETDAKALTRPMCVFEDVDPSREDLPPVEGVPGFYLVFRDVEHVVDLRTRSCDCRDFQYRDGDCYHIRRAEYATNSRRIPEWVDDDAIDDRLGYFLSL